MILIRKTIRRPISNPKKPGGIRFVWMTKSKNGWRIIPPMSVVNPREQPWEAKLQKKKRKIWVVVNVGYSPSRRYRTDASETIVIKLLLRPSGIVLVVVTDGTL